MGVIPKDGRPAFPVMSWGDGCLSGISVRDYYAAAALTGLVGERNLSSGALPGAEQLAEQCFRIADVFVLERERTVDNG